VTKPLPRRELRQLSADPRSVRRQHLARHLHACGSRPVLEALVAVDDGQPLDAVLEDFGRLPVRIYHEIGADEFPLNQFHLVKGRR